MTNEERSVLEYFIQQTYSTTHGTRSWGDRGKDTGPAYLQGPQPTLRDTGL